MKQLGANVVVREANKDGHGNGITLTTNDKNKFEIIRTYIDTKDDGKEKKGVGGMILSEQECLVLLGVLQKIVEVGKVAAVKKIAEKKGKGVSAKAGKATKKKTK